ncbi:TadE/TadG family type IV pilus assembly protein [Prosthecomicrobium sp. N25]|uniref:TadE/TadG family type IV pilus assembly protein n=1 Tax=Prosthecomicrobium sp. N25 TaxID=3129254 RepID=UPI003076C94A
MSSPLYTKIRDFASGPLARLAGDRRGSIAPMAAILGVVLFGAVGGAIDVSLMLKDRTKLQDLVDSAAIIGARDTTENWKQAAENAFDARAAPFGLTVSQRTFAKANGKLTADAKATISTRFLPLFSLSTFEFVAHSEVSIPGPPAACIYVVGTNDAETLRFNGGADVSLDCEIHVKTTKTNSAVFNNGIKLTTPRVCVEGSKVLDNNVPKLSFVKTSCTTSPDPYAGKLPPDPASLTCKYNGSAKSGTTITMSPGVYCGDTNFNGSPAVKLEPGLYIFKGGKWNVNQGSITGTDVTFYFADASSNLHFNSSVTANLKAPTTGAYANFLFYEKTGLSKSQWTFDAGKHKLEGIIYLPSRDLTYNSGSKESADSVSMVVYSLQLNGTKWDMAGYGTSGTSTITVPYVSK